MTDDELMQQLRELTPAEIPADVLMQIKQTARRTECNYTVLEIKVSGLILILMHKNKQPSMATIRKAYEDEIATLPTVGATQ